MSNNTFDMSEIRGALKRLAAANGQTKREVAQTAAKGFVRTVVEITPPASKGTAGTAAKKAGEATIASDVSRIFQPHKQETYDRIKANASKVTERTFGHRGAAPIGNTEVHVLTFAEMAAFHHARRKKDGRVMGPRRGAFASGNAGLNFDRALGITTGLRKKDLRGLDIGLVTTRDYDRFVRLLQKGVGMLAAGWNRAGELLGVKLPLWVRRHGSSRGEAVVTETATLFRLTLSNAVAFVDNVRGYQWRVQKAVDYQARNMNRQADYLLKKAMKKAGW